LSCPEPIIEICERIGLRNPAATQRRPLALTGARLEGLLIVWLLVRGREGSILVTAGLGLAGLALVLVPRPIITLSQHFVYVNTDDLEVRPWMEPAARLFGVLYLTVTLLSRSTGKGDDERRDARRIGPAVAPAPPPLEVTAESSIQRTTKRTLAIAPDLLEVIAPALLIDFGKRLAFETPDRGRVRPWTIPVARLEGLAFVRLLHRDDVYRQPSGRGSSSAAASWRCSRTAVEWGLGAAYENPDLER